MPAPRTRSELQRRTAPAFAYQNGRVVIAPGWALALVLAAFAGGIVAEATGDLTGRAGRAAEGAARKVKARALGAVESGKAKAARAGKAARRKVAEQRAALALRIAGPDAFAAGADDEDEDPRPAPKRKPARAYSAVALDRA